MHVLHVIDGLGLGGAERMLVDIANASVADGHRISVCITRDGTTLADELDARIERLVLSRRTRFDVRAFARLTHFVRRQRVDVIHAHMRSSLQFLLPLAATRAVRAPILFHDHYGTIETDTRVPWWFRGGHRYVAQYVGVYEPLARWAQSAGMPRERTATIANALNLNRLDAQPGTSLRSELGLPPECTLGLLVATLRPDKGIEVLLDAVAASAQRHQLHVAVAGVPLEPDYVERCTRQLARLGLNRTVTFLGGRTDVPALLRGVDFALLSSHTESGPLVLIEYVAASLPFVATRVGDIGRRIAAAGLPGFVPPGDPAAFAAALDQLLALSITERRKRGELGREVLTREWDIRAIMPRWYAAYRSALARAGRASA